MIKNFIANLRKTLKNNLTIILVPHTTSGTKKITLSFSFVLFVVILWSGITIWSGFISGQHFDYWRLQIDRELIKLKLLFFADQIKKSQDLLEQVRIKDEQLRALLDMKTKKSIIINSNDGKGGPGLRDKIYLEKYLSKKIDEISVLDLRYQIECVREEAKEILDSAEEIDNHITYQKLLYNAMPSMWPTSGRITSLFGFRIHPITGKYDFHTGLDIANDNKTPIYATASGTVKHVGWTSGYGRLIIINHGLGYETYYGHLSKPIVKLGQSIHRGDLIGYMGNTGTSTGTHLHYEINIQNKSVNPSRYLDKDTFFKKRSF